MLFLNCWLNNQEISKLMAVLVYVNFKITDFKAWRAVFDDEEEYRSVCGITTIKVMSPPNSPNEIHCLFSVESIEKFNAFINAPGIGEAMENATISGMFNYIFLNELPISEK